MTEPKDIDARLINWARWTTAMGSRGADCMTGAICESLRKAALGNVWSGHEVRDELDDADALRIERGMRRIPVMQRLLLKLHYVEGKPRRIICRRVRIRVLPESYFDNALAEAQATIEQVVDRQKTR